MPDSLDLKILHRSLLRAAGYDSDLAWTAIGQSYINLDTTRSVAEQVSFMRRSALGHILDVYTKRRNTAWICVSQMEYGWNDADDGDKEHLNIVTKMTAVDDSERSEDDIFNDYAVITPADLQSGLRIVLAAIFTGYFNDALTPELVRKLLQKNKVKGNASDMSRRLVKIIMENY